MNTRTFWFALASIIIVALVVGGVSKVGAMPELRPHLASGISIFEGGQSGQARVWRNTDWQRAFTLGSGQALYGPLHAEVGSGGRVFVIDYGELAVKEFRDGKPVRTYGHGRGQGPGEFGAITDLAIAPSGEVWVADHANGRISIFDSQGDLKSTLRPAFRPYRLALSTSSSFYLMQPSGADLFGAFGPAGNLQRSFGRLVEQQETFPLVLDGWIKPSGDGGFVYAGHFAGILGRYDRAGRPLFLTDTINAKSLPKLVHDSKGKMWVDREADASSWSMSVDGDEIHLLSAERNGVKVDYALDTYRLRDGKYLYSRALPEECDEIVVHDGSLFTVTATTVTQWRGTRG